MKHAKNFIKRMPLTQQLFVIVVALSVFLITFFFGFVTLSVDSFVELQMFNMIHESQEGIVENYLLGKTGSGLFGVDTSDMVHIIYNEDGGLMNKEINLEEHYPGIINKIDKTLPQVKNGYDFDLTYEKSSLISLRKINETAEIVTIMPIEYSQEFKSLLLNSFVYIILMVITGVFFLLLYWVGSIIQPLNQIREYIEKSRDNKEAELLIDREDEIGKLAEVLLEMQDELKAQQAQKEEMLQNISHDLKTPVATIKSYSEAIKDGIYPYETLEKSVDVIIEHADRLEKKVYNLLMLNRMDYMTHEKLSLDTSVRMNPIVEEVILGYKQIRPEINIEYEVDGDMFYGEVEPWRVVVENLLDNAIRYSETLVRIEVKDHYLSIYNDGEKVSQKRMDSFFKAYEMGDKGQFGLGLAIVHRVITNYKYNIQAKNKDKGVIFIIDRKD